MSSIAALPPPSSLQAPSGLSKLRQMLASDAVAVTPIRPIPDEEQRRRNGSSGQLQETDDALKGSGRAGLDETRNRARGTGGSSGGFAVGGDRTGGSAAVSPGPLPQTGRANAGFVTQSIHQEAMGSGLHIEPWSNAIGAYRRADAGPDTGPLVSSLSV